MLGKDKVLGAMARSAAVGTQWTQQRVEQAGYADTGDNLCKLCDKEVGTLWHRVSREGCTVLADYRKEYIGLLDDAYMDTHKPPLLGERALLLNLDKPRMSSPDREFLRNPQRCVDATDTRRVTDSKYWGSNFNLPSDLCLGWLKETDRCFTGGHFRGRLWCYHP